MSALLLVGGLVLLWFAVTDRADSLIQAVISPGRTRGGGSGGPGQPGAPGGPGDGSASPDPAFPEGQPVPPSEQRLDPGWHYDPETGWHYTSGGGWYTAV